MKKKVGQSHMILYIIRLGGKDSVEADLGAEKMLQAEKENRKIVIEVKSFLNRSIINDFHSAYGQFMFYKKALHTLEHDRLIYLAMPLDIFDEFDNKPYFKEFMATEMSLLVFNPIENTVSQWIN